MSSYVNVDQRSAVLSPDGLYRYSLTRGWSFVIGHACVFVMLNPSTADAEQDDATIRRCVGYASRWGAQQVTVVNLFAYRSTKPRDLFLAATGDDLIDIVGPDNDEHIAAAFRGEGVAFAGNPLVICAWGDNASGYEGRMEHVAYLARQARVQLMALGFTKAGQPVHPVRQPYERGKWLQPFEIRR